MANFKKERQELFIVRHNLEDLIYDLDVPRSCIVCDHTFIPKEPLQATCSKLCEDKRRVDFEKFGKTL